MHIVSRIILYRPEEVPIIGNDFPHPFLPAQPINNHCSPSYTNQSLDSQCKPIGWFLYDGEHWSLISKAYNCNKNTPSRVK